MPTAILATGGTSARVVQVDSAAMTTTTGWVTPAARTTSSNSDVIVGVDAYSAAFITVDIITGSGTSPTMNLFIQRDIPDGRGIGASTETPRWCDIASFAQFTSTAAAQRAFSLVNGGNQEFAVTTGTLTAGTSRTCPFGQNWRIAWDLGGTSPSWTFAVYATFTS